MMTIFIFFVATIVASWNHETGAAPPTTRMYFGIYSLSVHQRGDSNMAKAASSFATSVGPYYGASANSLAVPQAQRSRAAEAAQHGLRFAGHVPPPAAAFDSTSESRRPTRLGSLSEQSIRQHVRLVMDRALADSVVNSALGAWFVLPEEMRPWDAHEMTYLRIVASEIRQYDPRRRPVTMYNPGTRSLERLVAISSQGADWTMLGIYVSAVPFQRRAAIIRERTDRLVGAATRTATVPVAVFQLSRDFDSTELATLRQRMGGASAREAIRRVVRHDVYQALAGGARGIQVWSGCDCRRGLTTFEAQFEAYLSVANDLNGELRLAEVFLRGLAHTDIEFRSAATQSVRLSQWSVGDNRYLVLVNGSTRSSEVTLAGSPLAGASPATIVGTSSLGAHDSTRGTLTLSLAPLDVVVIKLTPTTPTP